MKTTMNKIILIIGTVINRKKEPKKRYTYRDVFNNIEIRNNSCRNPFYWFNRVLRSHITNSPSLDIRIKLFFIILYWQTARLLLKNSSKNIFGKIKFLVHESAFTYQSLKILESFYHIWMRRKWSTRPRRYDKRLFLVGYCLYKNVNINIEMEDNIPYSYKGYNINTTIFYLSYIPDRGIHFICITSRPTIWPLWWDFILSWTF